MLQRGDNQTGERLPMSGAEATRKGGWNMKKVYNGNIMVTRANEQTWQLKLKDIVTVSGSVYVRQGATLSAPKLARSGSVDVSGGSTLSVPKLARSGSVDVRQGSILTAPKLATVSGSVKDVREMQRRLRKAGVI